MMTLSRIAELNELLDAFDHETLGDDPAVFDGWLALHEERNSLLTEGETDD